jgi:hypothetical protein
MEGISSGPYRPVLAQIGLGEGAECRQQAHSASCTALMALISANLRYSLSTPSAVGWGEKNMALSRSCRLRGGEGGGENQSFRLSLSGGIVHHQDPFYNQRLVLWRFAQAGRNRHVSTGYLAPPL